MRPPGRTSTAPRPIRRAPRPPTSAAPHHAAELGAPLVYYSTDYVFDGTQARAVPRVGRAEPAFGLRPHEAARRGGGRRTRVDRAHVRPVRRDRARTSSGRCCGWDAKRDEVAVVRRPARRAHVRRPPRRGDEGAARPAVRHLASRRRRRLHVGRVRGGDLRGGRPRHPRPADLDGGARPPGPASRLLGAAQREPDAPTLPHWREGLRACLSRIA